MISKELLNEILPFGDVNFLISYGLSSDGDILLQYKDIDEIVNIYELAHMCKEWAFKKGYMIGTDLDKVNVWSIKERIIINHFEVYFEDYLEFEIKACQWILENK